MLRANLWIRVVAVVLLAAAGSQALEQWLAWIR
jgi:hypothetical protein